MGRGAGLIAVAAVLVNVAALARAQSRPAPAPAASSRPATAEATDSGRWSLSGSVCAYAIPDDRDCRLPAPTAGGDRLHLAARHHDGSLDTGPARVGDQLGGPGDLVGDVTPMRGGMSAHTTGSAPGYLGSSGWRQSGLHDAGEYPFAADEAADSFQCSSRTATAQATDAGRWSFSGSVYSYAVPEDRDYLQPTITADRDWLHLEARYNYEDLDTGSAWVGYNLGGGGDLAWEVTPMLGAVFGHTTGIAPGYKGSLSWWKLELYSEGEDPFDAEESSDSFFYNWSELSLAPVDWFRFGLVTQRTRAYDADRDIQRGVLVGVSYERLALTAYVLDLDTHDPTFVVSFGLAF